MMHETTESTTGSYRTLYRYHPCSGHAHRMHHTPRTPGVRSCLHNKKSPIGRVGVVLHFDDFVGVPHRLVQTSTAASLSQVGPTRLMTRHCILRTLSGSTAVHRAASHSTCKPGPGLGEAHLGQGLLPNWLARWLVPIPNGLGSPPTITVLYCNCCLLHRAYGRLICRG